MPSTQKERTKGIVRTFPELPPAGQKRLDEVINKTFNSSATKLPTCKEVLAVPDYFIIKFEDNEASLALRHSYVKYSFPILTHEFLTSISVMCEELGIKNIAELNCGRGYLSYWLKKYGVPITYSIDNKSWEPYKDLYLDCVTEGESIQFVKNHPEIQLFILSWAYMDDIAFKIWKAMRKDQYLLYIGESEGGCTADTAFYEATDKSVIEDRWNLDKNFLCFFGIHDRPILFQK